jgi:hypothetical protein
MVGRSGEASGYWSWKGRFAAKEKTMEDVSIFDLCTGKNNISERFPIFFEILL